MPATKKAPATRPAAGSGTSGAALVDAGELRTVAVGDIVASPYQPRRTFDDAALQELADSMAAGGLLQPITVRPHPARAGAYELIAGERRWRAAGRLGWATIPAVVKSLDDQAAAVAAAVENLQRTNLEPLEEAEAFARLLREQGWSQAELARRLGIPRATVGDRVRVLELPAEWLEEIRRGVVLQLSHAALLHPYRAAPDAVHAAALERARGRPSWTHAVQAEKPMAVDAFVGAVWEAYKPDLHPLTNDDYWEECELDPDAYTGPVVEVARWHNADRRRFAADPEQWRPLVAAAKRARAAGHDEDETPAAALDVSKAKPRAKATLDVEGTRVDLALALPGKPELVRVRFYADTPKGAVRLTTADGRWDLDGALRDVDLPDLAGRLTDANGAVRPGAVGRLVPLRFHDVGVDPTFTREADAVDAARTAYAARWAARREDLDADYIRAVNTAPAVGYGDGVRWLLIAALTFGHGTDSWRAEEDGGEYLLRLADALGIDRPAIDEHADVDDFLRAVRTWLQALPEWCVQKLAAAVVLDARGDVVLPEVQVKRERAAEQRAWVELPVPWITGSGYPEPTDEDDEDLDETPDEEEDEDEDEQPGDDPADERAPSCAMCECTETHACPGGCSWLAFNATHRVGVCDNCAASKADAEEKLEAFIADVLQPEGADA